MSEQAKKIEYDNPGTIMAIVSGGVADLIGMLPFFFMFIPPIGLAMLPFTMVIHYIAAVFVYVCVFRNIKHLLPKLVLLLFLILPIPFLFAGTVLAIIMQNRIVEFLVTQAAIAVVGLATAGVGAVAGEAAAGTAAAGEAGAAAGEVAAGTVVRGAESVVTKGAEEVVEGAAKKGVRSAGERFGEWAKEEAMEYGKRKAKEKLNEALGGDEREPTLDELLYETPPPGTLEETEESLKSYNPLENMSKFNPRQKKDEDVTLEDDGSVDLRKAA